MSRTPLVYVVYYSTYGHVEKLARQAVRGLEKAGVNSKLFQVAETLPQEVLTRMHAPPKASDVPVIKVEDLKSADGFLFGMPTRFGSTPNQFRSFMDATGQLWATDGLRGKFAGTFFSTASLGGGQETTALTFLPFLAHHGVNFVPLGSKRPKLDDPNLAVGGSAWGSGTLAGNDGRRQPHEYELRLAEFQGEEFGKLLKRVNF